MADWNKATLGEVATLNYGKSLPAKKRVPGEVAVYGSNGIVGSHDTPLVNSSGIIVGRKGSVGAVHIARQSFFPIDTTYFIAPKDTECDLDFLYYLLIHTDLPRLVSDLVPGLNRDLAYVQPVAVPPLPEQRRIAAVLAAVQRAVEQQERLIALTAELKKALMHKLFTEGTRGEPQKQTEIGPIPRSWDVVDMGKLFSVSPNNGLYKSKSLYGEGTLILRIEDFSNDGDVVISASNRVQADENDQLRFGLQKSDIVLNRVNSLSHLGKTALVGEIRETMLFESNMMRFRVDEKQVLPDYVFRFLNSPICKSQILGSAKRAVAQSSINQGDVAAIKVPLPCLEEQKEVVDAMLLLTSKGMTHQETRTLLQDMFKTLLHELMTAELRVDEVDLSELGALGIKM